MWIIIKIPASDWIYELDELVVCDSNGKLMSFPTLAEASKYQEEHAIDGKCIEVPTY